MCAVMNTSCFPPSDPIPRLPSVSSVHNFREYCLKRLLPAPASEVSDSVPTEFKQQLKWLYERAGSKRGKRSFPLPANRLNVAEWRRRLAGSSIPAELELLQYIENGIDLGISCSSTHFTKVRRARNLPSCSPGPEQEKLMNEIVKEVALGRVAGPFKRTPECLPALQYSPIGAVPKKNSDKLRMIFHLSYPRNGKSNSINSLIPPDKSTCELLRFKTAVEEIYRAGRGCLLAKLILTKHIAISASARIIMFVLALLSSASISSIFVCRLGSVRARASLNYFQLQLSVLLAPKVFDASCITLTIFY